MHPLLGVLLDASEGRFPPTDGGVGYLPPLEGGWETVLSLTGHSYIASRLGESELADLKPDGFGRALDPSVQQRMAGPGGSIGVLDVTLFARGTGGETYNRIPISTVTLASCMPVVAVMVSSPTGTSTVCSHSVPVWPDNER